MVAHYWFFPNKNVVQRRKKKEETRELLDSILSHNNLRWNLSLFHHLCLSKIIGIMSKPIAY